eukprot:PhM_4_TR5912/c0_g1_i1/m.60980
MSEQPESSAPTTTKENGAVVDVTDNNNNNNNNKTSSTTPPVLPRKPSTTNAEKSKQTNNATTNSGSSFRKGKQDSGYIDTLTGRTSYGAFVVTGNGQARMLPRDVMPNAVKLHPRGFRVLSHTSPFERNLKSYFRLQPKPPRRVQLEKQRVQELLHQQDVEPPHPPCGFTTTSSPKNTKKKGGRKKNSTNVIMDGYLVLAAAQEEDPANVQELVLEEARLVGVVADHLAFFTELEFVDVAENHLSLHDFAPLPKLNELHLQCNGINDLAGLEPGAFLNLRTLNLGFNSLSVAAALEMLCECVPNLERLDLSCNTSNNAHSLNGGNKKKGAGRPPTVDVFPPDLSAMKNLRQLALENNNLDDGCKVIESISTLPALVEVNLNKNCLTRIPAIAKHAFFPEASDGQQGDDDNDRLPPVRPQQPFAKLEVLGLANNNLTYFEDVYPILEWPNVRRVVLHGNPLQRSRRDLELTQYEFINASVAVVFDGPLPDKKSMGSFYSATVGEFVRVNEFRRVVMRPLYRRDADSIIAGVTASTAPPVPPPPHDDTAPSSPQQADVLDPQQQQQQNVPTTSFFMTQDGEIPLGVSSADLGTTTTARQPKEPKESAYDAALRKAELQNSSLTMESAGFSSMWDDTPTQTPEPNGGIAVNSAARVGAGLKTVPVRSALKELRRMLAQPLPPIGKISVGGRVEKM